MVEPKRTTLTLRERLILQDPAAFEEIGERRMKAMGIRIETFSDSSGKKYLRMVIGRTRGLKMTNWKDE